MSNQSAQAALQRLSDQYVKQLPIEVAKLIEEVHALSHENLQEIHHRLHKLAGSGGTFGFARLSQQARQLEIQVQTYIAAQQLPDADALIDLAFQIEQLALFIDVPIEAPASEAPASLDMMWGAPDKTHDMWIVEADQEEGEKLVYELSQFGFRARAFGSLRDAESTALSQQQNPSVLLFDLDQLGQEHTLLDQCMLQSLHQPHLFVVGHKAFHDRLLAARLRATAFFSRPVSLPKLVDRLDAVISQSQAQPYRILIVDDDATLAQHYQLILSGAGMDVRVLAEPEQIIEEVSDFSPEIILMDMHMPKYTGPELAAILRQHDEWLGIPIVYLSAETDLDTQLKVLQMSTADDFITKPIRDTHLVAAVRVRAARTRQLVDLMTRDGLTGLLSHTHIKEALQNEMDRLNRFMPTAEEYLCIAVIDIDHFKKINDTYGHTMGDKVIKSIAQFFRQRLRKTDNMGRYGGEEFLLVLPYCHPDKVHNMIDQMRQAFAQIVFMDQGVSFHASFSAGVACVSQSSVRQLNAELFFNQADHALYQAKQAGRNQTRIYEQA